MGIGGTTVTDGRRSTRPHHRRGSGDGAEIDERTLGGRSPRSKDKSATRQPQHELPIEDRTPRLRQRSSSCASRNSSTARLPPHCPTRIRNSNGRMRRGMAHPRWRQQDRRRNIARSTLPLARARGLRVRFRVGGHSCAPNASAGTVEPRDYAPHALGRVCRIRTPRHAARPGAPTSSTTTCGWSSHRTTRSTGAACPAARCPADSRNPVCPRRFAMRPTNACPW